jgi:rod shape-determining protein MreD
MNFRAYIFLFLAIIFQLSLAWRFDFLAVAPNLILATVIALAVVGNFRQIWLVFISGLFLDIIAGRVFGIFILSFLICFVLIHGLSKNFLKKNNFLSFFVLSAAGVVIFELVGFLLINLSRVIFSTNYLLFAEDFFGRVLPVSFVLNTLLASLIIFIFYKWNFFPKAEN